MVSAHTPQNEKESAITADGSSKMSSVLDSVTLKLTPKLQQILCAQIFTLEKVNLHPRLQPATNGLQIGFWDQFVYEGFLYLPATALSSHICDSWGHPPDTASSLFFYSRSCLNHLHGTHSGDSLSQRGHHTSEWRGFSLYCSCIPRGIVFNH